MSHPLHVREQPFDYSASHGASELSTFHTVYARLSHFHCVPVDRPTLSQVTAFTGTNLRRRLGSMLRQPLTTNEIHSPPVIFARSRSFGPHYDDVLDRHSRRMTPFPSPHRNLWTAGCSRPTGLEPLPTSLSPSGHDRDHCQVYGCDPYLDRPIVLTDCGMNHDHDRDGTLRSRVSRSDRPLCPPDQDEPDSAFVPIPAAHMSLISTSTTKDTCLLRWIADPKRNLCTPSGTVFGFDNTWAEIA